MVQPLWKTVWRCLKKLKIELPYDPAISLLGIYLGIAIILKDTRTPMFITAIFTIAKIWKQRECLWTDEWKQKAWHIYIREYYSTIEKNETTPFAATWMDLEIIVLNEVRERQIPYDITYKERK